MPESTLERALAFQLRAVQARPAQREFKFHPERRWRFDFAWPDERLAVEVEGGIWTKGAHNRGRHFNSDCDKYNAAVLAGWRVLRFTETHIRSGLAVSTILVALESCGEGPSLGRSLPQADEAAPSPAKEAR